MLWIDQSLDLSFYPPAKPWGLASRRNGNGKIAPLDDCGSDKTAQYGAISDLK